ncbi:hypothetical protein [Paenibacillus aceris]|uniref:TPP-dependent 2-oxoacid decarboxylase n=1 Tax=Paenibacillus aceris TaxID=869555 RepID=A0ABS4HZI6_9BACL|nr:hypothetical protein [Paenibacillus aceris]MBP1964102.1 TPP-dependent 2-oxoacid decarboxylase [Paenibacillus aceris]NHW36440.1 hypothetical protein [Paenibacillus aceris]
MLIKVNHHKKIPLNPQPYTVAELMLEQLRILGVERIYGFVGDAIFGLMDAIDEESSLHSTGLL